MLPALLLTLAGALPLASAHIAMFHPSMYGFNYTDDMIKNGDDNRPMAPLQGMTFDRWWFHDHLNLPPNPGDFFELPAGQAATTELACDKSVTSFFASKKEDSGTDLQNGNDPCPSKDPSYRFPSGAMHTNGFNDLKGCALAIAYESDVTKIKPEDFTVFSINQTCVWTRFTDFQVPARMPPCPEDGCHCAWFWIHADDSGGEQNYMNGFKCKVTNSTSNVALAKPKVPRRCGADPDYGKPDAAPGNCTYGAKQPFYWFQKEQNNMFEGQYAPPFYTDLYNFKDGAQDDIFVDSYPADLPEPNANSTFVPTPFLGPSPGASSSASSESSAVSSSSVQPASTTNASTSSTAQTSIPAQTSASAQSSALITFSAISPTGTSSVTVSTLSQTAASSASTSVTFAEPSLPLSTDSSSIPSFSQPSSASASSSVAVSTSVVVSTVVVTVTAQPAPTSTDPVGTASVFPSSPSSSAITPSSSILVSDSAGVSTGVASSAQPTSTFMATQAPPSASASTGTQTSVVAASTIVLGRLPSSSPSGGNALVADTPIQHGGVLAADSTASGKVCKREPGKRKVFRRRVANVSHASPSSREYIEERAEDSSLLSRIPGLRRHRKLHNRSRLWLFF